MFADKSYNQDTNTSTEVEHERHVRAYSNYNVKSSLRQSRTRDAFMCNMMSVSMALLCVITLAKVK